MSFSQKDEPLCKETRLYEKAGFPVGTALNTDKLKREENYWKTALAQFNSFSPEKILKAEFIHPKKDAFDFDEIDHLIAFCRDNKIRLHGHTLIWHKSLPQWMVNFKGSPEQWDAILRNHVQTIVAHCRSYINSWDVVNEAFNDDGSLRHNIWYKKMGESYIAKAFRYAAEADPNAKLFYNDYGLEKNGEKLNGVLDFFSRLKKEGVQIDGFGMQMHVSLVYPTVAEITEATQRLEQAGYLVHYSELDISLSADRKLFSGGKKLVQQSERMRNIVKSYMKLKPASRFGITLWGVSDNDSWLSDDNLRARPLLFDRDYKIKPAYCGFLDGLEK